jgi:hypothetical protein
MFQTSSSPAARPGGDGWTDYQTCCCCFARPAPAARPGETNGRTTRPAAAAGPAGRRWTDGFPQLLLFCSAGLRPGRCVDSNEWTSRATAATRPFPCRRQSGRISPRCHAHPPPARRPQGCRTGTPTDVPTDGLSDSGGPLLGGSLAWTPTTRPTFTQPPTPLHPILLITSLAHRQPQPQPSHGGLIPNPVGPPPSRLDPSPPGVEGGGACALAAWAAAGFPYRGLGPLKIWERRDGDEVLDAVGVHHSACKGLICGGERCGRKRRRRGSMSWFFLAANLQEIGQSVRVGGAYEEGGGADKMESLRGREEG